MSSTRGGFGRGRRLTILIYHRLVATPDPLQPDIPTVRMFEQDMHFVRRFCTPLPLAGAVERLAGAQLPPRAVCVTFDDGYADNEHAALPVLERFGIPAAVFVATDFIGGGLMWNDRIIEGVRRNRQAALDLTDVGLQCYAIDSIATKYAAVQTLLGEVRYRSPAERLEIARAIETQATGEPPRLMMDLAQLRKLVAAGVDIGGHTCSHPILTRIPEAEARDEICAGMTQLEDWIQSPVDIFAYPNGSPRKDYAPAHVDILRERNIKAAVTTGWGAAGIASDRLQLPRFTPWGRPPLKFAAQLVRNYFHPVTVCAPHAP